MQREGSALHGLGVVFLKETSDHLSSIRMRVLEWIVVLFAIGALYFFAIPQITEVTAEDPFLLLRLFTTARDPLPFNVLWFLTILVPLVAIGLGFDSVNGEHNKRTLSRILSQPIYRDALLFGKFLAGLFTLSISLIALWLLVIGFGLFYLGVPPSAEELARAFIFLLVVIAYAGVWLALAMLFSIVFRSAATAVIISLGLWLFFWLIWPWLSQLIVVPFAPTADEATLFLAAEYLSRLSPTKLFSDIVQAVLNPSTRSLGPIYFSQLQGAVIGAPMPLGQSLLIAWPEIVGLIASTIILFVGGYVIFQRQEVRA